MSLSPGARLGQYEVSALIGVGGMGEVYRARDIKLQRDVAIKILPASVPSAPERLARFEREAQLLAALNHPHIGAIYGVEESAGGPALVLELVHGPTLADVIASGPVPLEDARRIAGQIASALEAAHEQGIIHRDLKPANIKLRPDGVVKVLDFGLAKALEHTGVSDTAIMNSPTIVSHATEAGLILGSAAYMAPEQARGQPVDKRADIWAFGVVLYEMITGRPLFTGTNTTDVLAAVVRQDIDWRRLPGALPTAVGHLLRRCLERDPRERLRDIGEARVLLQQQTRADDGPAARPSAPRAARIIWPMVAGVLAIALAVLASTRLREREAPSIEPLRFTIPALTGMPVPRPTLAPVLAVSPDGRHTAIATAGAIWLWTNESGEAHRLDDTAGGTAPFFSPDGRQIAFFAAGELRAVALTGGPASTIARGAAGIAGSWGQGGVIVFNRWLGSETGLWSVPARGGEPTLVAGATRPTELRAFPAFLPDGRHYLYLLGAYGLSVGARRICVASLEGGEPECFASGDSNPAYSATGHVLFVRRGTLVALPFDIERLRPSGEAISVARNARWFGPTGAAAFAVSANGRVLIHALAPGGSRLVWLDRAGREVSQVGDRARYGGVHIAPDGKRAAVEIWNSEREGRDLFLLDLASGVTTRLTSDPADAFAPVWSPDGRGLAYSKPNPGPPDLAMMSIDRTGPPRILLTEEGVQVAQHWSPDARRLAYVNLDMAGAPDQVSRRQVWLLSIDGGQRRRLRDTPAESLDPRFSPDGRHIAYVSYGSGDADVYVAPVDGDAPGRRVSRSGGFLPRWRGDGRELFFEQPDGVMVAVDPFAAALSPALLFRLSGLTAGYPDPTHACDACGMGANQLAEYDVTPDGQRFLVRLLDDDGTNAGIRVAMDWSRGARGIGAQNR
jgi:Tol biopolymer transport system component